MRSQHLDLPFIMPSQAQKHVTHNEALTGLDALVQLACADRDRTEPPAAPEDGARYVVGDGATGLWQGHDGEIAAFVDGGWRFHVPREGWLVWLENEGRLLVHRGGSWRYLSENMPMLGVNATPDAVNRLAVASRATLLSHDGGDHQVVVNKAGAASRASLLFQSGFSGRAELGLVGDDDLSFKVSTDGAAFIEAMRISAARGDTTVRSLNSGPLAGLRNAIINGSGAINQRGFAGGALSGYGYDRWRSEASGTTLTVAGGRFALAGAIGQTMERSGLAGSDVTVSVETPTADITVTLGTRTAVITAGGGRRHVSFVLAASEVDDLKLVLATAAEAEFADVQVEPGLWPTPFERRPVALEEMLCRRYFEVSHPVFSGAVVAGSTFRAVAPYTVAKRVVPTATVMEVEYASNTPALPSAYTASGLSRTTGAHIFFVADATSPSAGVQLEVSADAEF